MPVNSNTIVVDDKDNYVVSMYRRYNSYPSIHGQCLFEILKEYSKNPDPIRKDMTNLAAHIVKHFKKDNSDIYIGLNNNCAFCYIVYPNHVVVKNHQGYTAFIGSWDEFENFCTPDE